jgi:hypothetical protein
VKPRPAPDYWQVAALSFATPAHGWAVRGTRPTGWHEDTEVSEARDGGTHSQMEARTRPVAPPEPKLRVGNITGYGHPTGVTFLADGYGWLLQDRGYVLTRPRRPRLDASAYHQAR